MPAPAILGFDRSHWDALVRYLERATRGKAERQDVEDAISHALLRACERPPAHRNLMSWLHVVAMNALRDALKSKHQKGREVLGDDDGVSSETPESQVLAREAEAERAALLARVQALLPTLPAHERDALLLSVDGEEGEAIGAQLGCSPGAVRMRVMRARRRLRAQLAEDHAQQGVAA